jgi:hypothetical protein
VVVQKVAADKRKKDNAAIFQKNKEVYRSNKQIAEDVLESHGYRVKPERGSRVRGGGLTASKGGKYVATFKRTTSATSECPHVAALVFNLFAGGEPKHKLKFAELAKLGLDQGKLEQQAAALVVAVRVKQLAKAAAEAAA